MRAEQRGPACRTCGRSGLAADEQDLLERYRAAKAEFVSKLLKPRPRRVPSKLFVATRVTVDGEIPCAGFVRIFAFAEIETLRAFVGEDVHLATTEYVATGPVRPRLKKKTRRVKP